MVNRKNGIMDFDLINIPLLYKWSTLCSATGFLSFTKYRLGDGKHFLSIYSGLPDEYECVGENSVLL